jgi:hypothetical protein
LSFAGTGLALRAFFVPDGSLSASWVDGSSVILGTGLLMGGTIVSLEAAGVSAGPCNSTEASLCKVANLGLGVPDVMLAR